MLKEHHPETPGTCRAARLLKMFQLPTLQHLHSEVSVFNQKGFLASAILLGKTSQPLFLQFYSPPPAGGFGLVFHFTYHRLNTGMQVSCSLRVYY